MFTTERYHLKNSARGAEKGLWPGGTRLAKDEIVKEQLTYRNITLALGICVALIVALTLWGQRKRSTIAVAASITTTLSVDQENSSWLNLIRKIKIGY